MLEVGGGGRGRVRRLVQSADKAALRLLRLFHLLPTEGPRGLDGGIATGRAQLALSFCARGSAAEGWARKRCSSPSGASTREDAALTCSSLR